MPFNKRNIIIFVGIAAVFFSAYIFFIGGSDEPEANLISSSNSTLPDTEDTTPLQQTLIAQNFLSLLLNVKTIKLDDSIFSLDTFNSLRDSSIILFPDGNEGRPNPFAQLGADSVEAPSNPPIIGNKPGP